MSSGPNTGDIMQIKKHCWPLAIILIFLFNGTADACTNITASRSGVVLVGQNWDWKNLDIYLWFVPPEKDLYGCIFYGLKKGYPSGGMNDQGLVIGATLSPKINIKKIKEKKTVTSPIDRIQFYEFLNRRCATVGQVIKEIKKINLISLQNSHALITDRTGDSVILEGDGKGNLVLFYRDRQVKIVPDGQTKQWVEKESEPLPLHLQKNRDFQVISNFLHSQLGLSSRLGGYPCWRYNVAQKLLTNSEKISPSLFRDILKKTHLEGEYPTKLSTVYDLKKGNVYFYYLHDYKKLIHFNLEEEFKKGAHSYDLSYLFKLRWHPLFLLFLLIFLSSIFAYTALHILWWFRKKKSLTAIKKRQCLTFIALIISGINSLMVLILIYRFPYILSHQIKILKFNLYENFFNYYKEVFFAILVLSMAMLLFSIFAWINKYWTTLLRIHYSLVTIASLLVIVLMI